LLQWVLRTLMRLKLCLPAPDEHSRFAAGCFDGMLGKPLPMEVDGTHRDTVVTAVEYPEGGREVLFTVRWDGKVPGWMQTDLSHFKAVP